MLQDFFGLSCLGRSQNLTIFLFLFLHHGRLELQKSTCSLINKLILGLVFWPELSGSFVFQSPREFYVLHFLEQILICAAYTRRCLWCNGNHCGKWTLRSKIDTWMRLFAFHIVLILLGKVWIHLFSIQWLANSRAL